MNIDLYVTRDNNNVLNKTLTNQISRNCEIIEMTNILQPVLKIKGLYNHNYCYIPFFSRYYYITDISYHNGISYLYLRVDVLMSYKDDIKNLECYITRQENTYNKNIPDNYMIGQIKKQEEQRVLPTIFEYEPNDNYLLITV